MNIKVLTAQETQIDSPSNLSDYCMCLEKSTEPKQSIPSS